MCHSKRDNKFITNIVLCFLVPTYSIMMAICHFHQKHFELLPRMIFYWSYIILPIINKSFQNVVMVHSEGI